MPRIAALTCLVPCVLAACGVSDTVCTMEARAGINVVVTDSVTGSPVTTGVTLIVQDGTYRDSTNGFPGANSLGSAWEREGVYAVTVRADGYAVWNKSGVRVQSDECHVKAVTIPAKLQRS